MVHVQLEQSMRNKVFWNGFKNNLFLSNAYVCACPTGYFGTNCATSSACGGSPCLNGGTCTSQPSVSLGYYCACAANYYGTNCQTKLTQGTCTGTDTSPTLCPVWASLNLCNYQYLYNLIPVPVYCPLSCQLCNQVSQCIDTQTSCSFWATSNLCASVNAINPNLCRKSCNNCPTGSK